MTPITLSRRSKTGFLAALLLTLLVGSRTAQADYLYRLTPGGFDVVATAGGGERVVGAVALGGEPVYDILRLGDALYVAHGASGVAIYDIRNPEKPVEINLLPTGRSAVKLVGSGSSLVVVVADYGAVAFDVTDPRHPLAARLERALAPVAVAATPAAPIPVPPHPIYPATPAERAEQSPLAPARVTAMRAGWLYLESSAPLRKGARFVIKSQRTITVPDPVTGRPVEVPSNRLRGQVVVERVEGTRGAGPLPKGTIAEVGDIAEPITGPPEEDIFFPHLWPAMTRINLTVRPFLPVSTLGLGMISDLSLDYYFNIPLKIGVEINPLGLLAVSDGTGLTGEVHARIAFASDYFELGLAPGVEFRHYGASSAFSLAYALRIGSLDGLNLQFQNSYVVVDGGGKKRFAFESAFGEANIPVHRRLTLTFEGGGAGSWAYGMIGIKAYVRGAGGPGTIIVRTAIGGALVSDLAKYDPANPSLPAVGVEAAGPAIAFGLDMRF